MANFVWTAKNMWGDPVVREVKSATVEESKAVLLSEGCTDLVLKEDDIISATLEGFDEKSKVFGDEIVSTAEARIKARDKQNRGAVAAFFGDNAYLFVAILIIGFAFRFLEPKTAIVTAMVVIPAAAFIFWVRLPLIYYNRINKAKDWHRWDQVLKLVETSELIRRFHFIKLPKTELPRCRAQALTGMGRLSEAVYIFQFAENQPGMPGWLYKSYLSGIYGIAKQGDKVIELTLEAIAMNPNAALYIDLAESLLRYKRDTAQAREALAVAEGVTLTDLAAPFLHRCRGVLAYLEGDLLLAKKELSTSLEISEATRRQPFRDGMIAIVKARLCCVHAKMGDNATAKKLFAQSKDYLVATDESELLAECQLVMGQ
jgi:tetratricopeptide (TPR) repeat protein